MSPNVEAYFDIWVQLDDLWLSGKGDSEEADTLRDSMDAPWYKLSDAELEELEKVISESGRSL